MKLSDTEITSAARMVPAITSILAKNALTVERVTLDFFDHPVATVVWRMPMDYRGHTAGDLLRRIPSIRKSWDSSVLADTVDWKGGKSTTVISLLPKKEE